MISDTQGRELSPESGDLLIAKPERAIQTASQDRLHRDVFVQRLVSALIDPQSKQATGVVVGVVGPWGSGKTSVLNLLHEAVEDRYAGAVVVRFDPWIVSGRDSLIAQFLGELSGTIRSREKWYQRLPKSGLRGLLNTIGEYGGHLAAVANVVDPATGAALGAGAETTKGILKKRSSIHAIRKRLAKQLSELESPIVVLIDELDRVEDDEVRAVAQLVRAVADFPNISYVLAYDPARVVEALGKGSTRKAREEHGTAYLEKIVQFQIPMPCSLDEEIYELISAELSQLQRFIELPHDWKDDQAFVTLCKILVPRIISTPRDVRKMLGTYHVLEGMLRGEVDWVDLLGFSVLLIKFPRLLDSIRRQPDAVVSDPLSTEEQILRFGSTKLSNAARLNRLNQGREVPAEIRKLLQFLFPTFVDDDDSLRDALVRAIEGRVDRIKERKVLQAVLYLGIPPGAVPRSEVMSVFGMSSQKVAERLRQLYASDKLSGFLNRVSDLYPIATGVSHVEFWTGVGTFLSKDQPAWETDISPMKQVARSFADLFDGAVKRNAELRDEADTIVRQLNSKNDVVLLNLILRRQVFAHGLFRKKKRADGIQLMSASEVERLVCTASGMYREQHLGGHLLQKLWDIAPIYNMNDAQVWDDKCREKVLEILLDDKALDGFVVLVFSGPYSIERSDVDVLVDCSLLAKRINDRLESASDVSSNVRELLERVRNKLSE